MFFVLNIFFIFVIIFSPVDSHFGFCSYGHGEMGVIHAKCPFLLGWYGGFAEFTVTLFYLVFLSAFIGFLPVILVISFYIAVLGHLIKKIKSTQDLKEIIIIKGLIVSTSLFPILFASSYFLTNWNVSTPLRKQVATVESNKKIMEQKIDEVSNNGQDYCVDAPEDIFLTPPKDGFDQPKLYFPAGYWDGVGIMQVSKENSWDGVSDDSEFVFYTNDQLTNFSSSNYSSVYRRNNNLNDPNNNTPDIKIGQKYDVRIRIIKKDQIPVVLNDLDNKPVSDEFKFAFKDGTFTEKFKNGLLLRYGNGDKFGVSSSTRINSEKCLTVFVREKTK